MGPATRPDVRRILVEREMGDESPVAAEALHRRGYLVGEFATHRFFVEAGSREFTNDQRNVLLGQILWAVPRHSDLDASTTKLAVSSLL